MSVLRSPYLSQTTELRRLAAGGGALALGTRSVGVAQVQAALRDLGYGLVRSTGPRNQMDGLYGTETADMVRAFQRDRALPQTGVVELRTLTTVDKELAVKFPVAPKVRHRPGRLAVQHTTAKPAARNAKPIAAPDERPLPFWDDNYEIGTADPSVEPDIGAGGWNSKRKTFSAISLAQVIQRSLGLGTSTFVGPNATRHLRHYFGNHGQDLTIDLENMVRVVPSARAALILEFRQAQDFLRALPPGRYDFTSRRTDDGYNQQSENTDWYFATGGYSVWGQGRAQIDGSGANRRYDVDFTYKFFDRYNWDGDKQVEIGGIVITDEFMGEFHRQGLAREYNCFGSLRRRFSWTGDLDAPRGDLIVRPGGR